MRDDAAERLTARGAAEASRRLAMVAMAALLLIPAATAQQYVATPETFAETFAKLGPGDTLVLEDGLYEHGIAIRDRHGEEGAPIKIRARNERRAFFRADGTVPALHIVNSSHWHVEGLRLENQDNPEGEDTHTGGLILVSGSSDIVLRRNLCARPNRYGNNTGIKLDGGTTHSLVEENELYDFQRNGLSFHGTETRHNIMRRNYVARGRDHLGRSWGPNDGIVLYRGADSIVENNIVEFHENEGHGFGVWGQRNELIGNIALTTRSGFPLVQGWRSHSGRADGTVLRHNVALNSNGTAFYTNSVQDVVLENNSSIGAGGNGLTFHNARGDLRGEDFRPSVRVANHLSVGSGGHGFEIRDLEQFAQAEIVSSYGWKNEEGTWGPGTENVQRTDNADPRLRASPLWVPKSSPLKGRGRDGADVGANILYRTENGQLTDQPLWDPETGAFPHGAIVEGVNDRPGESLFDVHERLGVTPDLLRDAYASKP